MNIFWLPRGMPIERCAPLIILVDMQREFVSDGRPSYIERAADAVAKAAILLQFARERRLPITHFRTLKADHEFNSVSAYSHWIDSVKPRPNEHVYDRSQPSCFSNEAFSELIDSIEQPYLIIAGMGSERSCLATVLDGFHRGCTMVFVEDCSACRALASWSEEETHLAIQNITSSFAMTVNLDQFINRLNGPRHENLLR